MTEAQQQALEELRSAWFEHLLADEIAHALDRWDDAVKWSKPSLGECYEARRSALHLHLQLGVVGNGGVAGQYCVLLYSALP